MRWQIFLSLVVLLTLCSTAVIAASNIEVTPIKNQITLGEEASFQLTITNNAHQTQRYSTYSLQSGQGWSVDPSPLRDKIIELAAGESRSTKIVARPLDNFQPGIYYVQISVESDLGERYSESLKVYLGSERLSRYLPSLKATLDMNDKIDPRQSLSIKLFLENKNPLNLSDLTVKIQSDIPEFVQETVVDVPPLERKTIEFTIIPNKYQQPKESVLFFVFEQNGQTVKVLEKKIEVLPLLPPFVTTLTTDSVFLKNINSLRVLNPGNVRNTQEVEVPLTLTAAILSSGGGKIVMQDNQRHLVWDVSLGPGEETTIYFVTNYRLALYLLLIVMVILIAYLYLRSPLEIRKTATTAKSMEGGLSEIKITLELRNKSKKAVKHVKVTDLVPTIANVEKSLELGTLKPEQVHNTAHGTKVIWSLAEIDAQEHRLITYKVKAKLHILGTFSLPRATVTFERSKGKHRKIYSNLSRLGN
ncbi:TPA: hypothetical protein HA241_00230 [Candidatus Woesearchaeota archaeon]|nr:hypothetical protein [Candidatus Woesearchaeota archaeon]